MNNPLTINEISQIQYKLLFSQDDIPKFIEDKLFNKTQNNKIIKNHSVYIISLTKEELLKLDKINYNILLPVYEINSKSLIENYNIIPITHSTHATNVCPPWLSIITNNISNELYTSGKWINKYQYESQKIHRRYNIFHNLFKNHKYDIISIQEGTFKNQQNYPDYITLYNWDDLKLFEEVWPEYIQYKDTYDLVINKIYRRNKVHIANSVATFFNKKKLTIELLDHIPLVLNFNFDKQNGRPIQVIFFTCRLIYINLHAPHINDTKHIILIDEISKYIYRFCDKMKLNNYLHEILNKLFTYKVIVTGDLNRSLNIGRHHNHNRATICYNTQNDLRASKHYKIFKYTCCNTTPYNLRFKEKDYSSLTDHILTYNINNRFITNRVKDKIGSDHLPVECKKLYL